MRSLSESIQGALVSNGLIGGVKIKNTNTRICDLTRKVSGDTFSGVKGVSFHKPSKRWRASIILNKKAYYLGYYEKKEDAVKARQIAEKELFHPIIEEYENLTKE